MAQQFGDNGDYTQMGTPPGDGLALAHGILWVPGHDGTLYGLDPATGALVHRIPIGGKLSSAPLAAHGLLYLSLDVPGLDAAAGGPLPPGSVAAVDPTSGRVAQHWPVSRYGLRAQPVAWGHVLYVGDRRGGFYALDTRRGRVETLPTRGGRILGTACVDEKHGRVIVGDSYGWLLAFDRAGRERWAAHLGGAVVGQPLLHDGVLLLVGAGDGRVYMLNPATGQPVHEPFPTRDAIATAPVGWRDLVFVGSNDGYLYALEASTGRPFWQYHSGAPVIVSPAVTPAGRLYVADSAGHLNALRWCLARYAEGARRAQRPEEAVELWLAAGETQAALEAAQQAGRLDLAARLALDLNWHDRAARCYEQLASKARDPGRAAVWWAEAAAAWELAGDDRRADHCRLQDAQGRGAPLLSLQEASLPRLTLGQPDTVQVRVVNRTAVLARDVALAYEGHVQRAGERSLGSLGPHEERLAAIEVTPTESGSATLRVTARYADPADRPQRPAYLELRLKVAQPPEVHHHYYGPHVGGDGVIIMRGGLGVGRSLRVQSGEDAVEIARPGGPACPYCGQLLEAGARYCHECGHELPGNVSC